MADGIAIVCCAKLEDRYLVEWIRYNIECLKFDAIYIYDNNTTPDVTQTTLAELDEGVKARVFVRHEPDSNRLLFRAFGHWLATEKHKYKAVAFIDPDEFLVLHKHANVHELLEQHLYPRGGALGINWMMFGSSGHTSYEPGPVTQRFTMRCERVNRHIKTFAVCQDLLSMVNPHLPHLVPGKKQWSTAGEAFHGSFLENGPIDVAQLNHYWTKTYEEWLIKRNKGHIDIDPNHRRPLSEFTENDYNEVFDNAAWQIYMRLT